MIITDRIKKLNQKKICKGDYVLYWMQASQRVEWNHALEYAIREANQLNLPVLVYFRLIDNFPEANERQWPETKVRYQSLCNKSSRNENNQKFMRGVFGIMNYDL